MIERLVENWLDSAGERTYQRCFCQMLIGQGYQIVHNTEHTPLEFGKDVIALSAAGALVGFQLKGNPGVTLKPSEFAQIRGQLEQLAILALTIPGLPRRTLDECYLVTNGEIDEAVYHQIQQLNVALAERGHPPDRIKTITRGTLLDWSKSLGLALWPSEMQDFGNLVRLLNYEGDEMFPANVFDALLRHTLRLDHTVPEPELRRRVTSAAIMTAVALHSFSRQKNHFAEITAWMMFITYTVASCEKNRIDLTANCNEAISAARQSIYNLLGSLCDEAAGRPDGILVEGDPLSEFAFYRPRLLLMYMLMAVYWLWSEEEGWRKPEHKQVIERLIRDNLPNKWLWGEAAIPHFLAYTWYRKRVDATSRPDRLLADVLGVVLRNKLWENHSLAAPYYTIEDVVRHKYRPGLLCADPYEGDNFKGTSYVCETLLVCLVRGNWKQTCKELWPDFTRVAHERVVPDQPWQFCLFRTGEEATNDTNIPPLTMTWAELQDIARECDARDVPAVLKADPILLLLFVNVFPFRASFSAMKFLHKKFDGTWHL